MSPSPRQVDLSKFIHWWSESRQSAICGLAPKEGEPAVQMATAWKFVTCRKCRKSYPSPKGWRKPWEVRR